MTPDLSHITLEELLAITLEELLAWKARLTPANPHWQAVADEQPALAAMVAKYQQMLEAFDAAIEAFTEEDTP